MECSYEKVQLHVRVAVLHAFDSIEPHPDALGEHLLRQPSAAARAVDVFAKLRECPLYPDRKRFLGFTAFIRAFKICLVGSIWAIIVVLRKCVELIFSKTLYGFLNEIVAFMRVVNMTRASECADVYPMRLGLRSRSLSHCFVTFPMVRDGVDDLPPPPPMIRTRWRLTRLHAPAHVRLPC